MVYSDSLYHPALTELARAGNLRAIAHWLNQALIPFGMKAVVGAARPGCLKILIEFEPLSPAEYREIAAPLQDSLMRFVCHRLWRLNSGLIEGISLAARFTGSRQILWEQSIRINAPARRQRQQQSRQLQKQIQQTTRRKDQLKTARALLMSGSTVVAFICGGVIAYVKAPVDQSGAVAPSGGGNLKPSPRSNEVKAALETLPVVKHTEVANPNDPTITLLFSGDVTLGESFAESVGNDYKWAFAEMDEYRQADLAMVNLETPLTTATDPLPGKQFSFKSDPELATKILTDGGVDIVTLANNHAMDYQEAGLTETLNTLSQAGIEHVGAGQTVQDARRPQVIDVKGQRIAYLGYYTADFQIAGITTPGTNYAEEARIAEDIRALRSQVDWIVVNYHWGEELATHPADWQQQLAYFTIDQGADLVVGHHPHVLQGAEIYKGRPIAYSLGNFIFGGNSRSDYDTAVLKVSVNDRQMKAEFLPVEVRGYQPKVVADAPGQAILQQIADRSSGFQSPMQSPVVLDARPTSSNTAAATSQPANSSQSVIPVPSPVGSPAPNSGTEPVAPPADSSLAVPPGDPSSSTTPTTGAVEPTPQSPIDLTNPVDPFINSPQQTPFDSTSSETWATPTDPLSIDPNAATDSPDAPEPVVVETPPADVPLTQ